MNLFTYIFYKFDVSKQRSVDVECKKLILNERKKTQLDSNINNIKDFKTIALNINFLKKFLKKDFSAELKKKINDYLVKIDKPTLPISTVIEAYESLPKKIRNTDGEKIVFIRKFCSVEKYKGK